MTDRWLMPITLPLYSVIFSEQPQEEGEKVAAEFADHEHLDIIIAHSEEELNEPKQKLINILNPICREESKMRAFLRSFVNESRKISNHSDSNKRSNDSDA